MAVRAPRIAALLLAGALLTGCAAETGRAAPPSPPSTDAQQPAPPSETPAATEGEATDPAPAQGAYVEYTDGVIEATPGSKALFFHASWCPQCRALDEDLKSEGVPDGLTVFKVDYDSRTDLRQRYGVTLQTTIVFVDDSGESISSIVLYDDPSARSLAAAIP